VNHRLGTFSLYVSQAKSLFAKLTVCMFKPRFYSELFNYNFGMHLGPDAPLTILLHLINQYASHSATVKFIT
jgi:hypothetical protein